MRRAIKFRNRLWAVLLAFVMISALIPVTAWAGSGDRAANLTSVEEFSIPDGGCGTVIEAVDISDGITGGTAPYSYQLGSDSPEWLVISSEGLITGTRPDSGQSAATATVVVTDSSEPAQNCAITVHVGEVTAAAASEEKVTQDKNTADETAEEQTEETVNVSGKVVWVDRTKQNASSRPASSTVRLLANGSLTGKYVTVTASNDSAGKAFSFTDLPKTDKNGTAIVYTVSQDTVTNYETTYSADTLTITNSYIGGVPQNHKFGHIDVRIEGASLEITYLLKDTGGNVISKNTEKISASVTKVESVSITTSAGTQTYTNFSKSGNYEFRKTSGVSINSSTLNSGSAAALVVDLVDANGKTYDNVSIQYGLGGIMSAAYNCDGYSNSRFDGLDFNVGTAQNYTIEITSYGLGITVDKKIKEGSGNAAQFTGSGGEFTFDLTEYEGTAATGRTWTVSNNADGSASLAITYPYSNLEEMEAYAQKTYRYTLSEKNVTASGYLYDDTVYSFTVKFTIESVGSGEILKPAIQEEAYADGTFSFINSVLADDSIVINKVDENGDMIDGAEFGLYSDKELSNEVLSFSAGSFELSTDNPALASCLPTPENPSTLYLVETQAPKGYTGDSSIHLISIYCSDEGYVIQADDEAVYFDEDETAAESEDGKVLNIINSRINESIVVNDSVIINKVDEQGTALDGASFTVCSDYACTDSVMTFTAGTYELSTDAEALAQYLPAPGCSRTFFMKETTPPLGYESDSSLHVITIDASRTDGWNEDHSAYVTTVSYTMLIDDSESINVENNRINETAVIDDTVTITKTDLDGEIIQGADFTVYSDAACANAVTTFTAGSYILGTDNAALASYLPKAGSSTTLYLKETNPPKGYTAGSKVCTITVSASEAGAWNTDHSKYVTTVTYSMAIEGNEYIRITNSPVTGTAAVHDSVNIQKVDENGDALEGAGFTVYSDSACTNSVTTFTAGSYTLSSDNAALASYLPKAGSSTTLYLKETNPPKGYTADSTVCTITVSASEAAAWNTDHSQYVTTVTYNMAIEGNENILITNSPVTGTAAVHDSVNIKKADENGNALEGADFTVYSDSACTNSVITFTAGSYTLSSDNAALAQYLPKAGSSTTLYLKETSAPEGYNPDSTVYALSVTAEESEAWNAEHTKLVATTTYTMKIDGSDSLTVTNAKKQEYGSLTVKKTVTGDQADTSRYFTFTIVFDAEGSFDYTGSKSGSIKSGDAVLLKHGESITITGLPAGTVYSVTESGNTGYQVYSSGSTGTISANGIAVAAFTNAKSSAPATGDHTDITIWLSITVLSAVGLIITAMSNKKKNDRHSNVK